MPSDDNNDWSSAAINSRLLRLDRLLHECEWLWRPQPYKQSRPAWCERLPQLCEALLGLDDEQLRRLNESDEARVQFLLPHIPQLAELSSLIRLSPAAAVTLDELGPHFHTAIPGRKWQQITRFAAALGTVRRPLLEWCGGKGHLGRLLSAQWQQPVVTVEHNGELCQAGEELAHKAGTRQRFMRVDALSAEAGALLQQHHAVALHACGELHRSLLRQAVKGGVQGFDIAPCCYYIGAGEFYRPFSDALQLRLSRDDLRMAVTETVTAAGREVVKRDREMAWKLGYDQLRREVTGESGYRPQRPINKRWLALDFAAFCQQLAEREAVLLPAGCDWQHFEMLGWQRQREVMRLSLVRAAFRRALEMWLVLDMAHYVSAHGYRIRLATFCERELTPRNILLSARKD